MNVQTLATYNRIAQMRATIDSFISQAMVASSNINTRMSGVVLQPATLDGVGKNVNLLA